jgi:hypothetical protein
VRQVGYLQELTVLIHVIVGVKSVWNFECNDFELGHWGDQDVDGRIILRWIFRKVGGGSWELDGVG